MEGEREGPEVPFYTIVPDGDLVFELVKSDQSSSPQQSGRRKGRNHRPQKGSDDNTITVAKFRVDRATMINLPKWNQRFDGPSIFKRMLTGDWKEAKQTTVELYDHDEHALRIFLTMAHRSDPKDLLNYGHEVMWPLIAIFDQYNVSLKSAAENWYSEWYKNKGDKSKDIDPREMLYPCWKFNHAPGFLKASHACIYGVERHINDHNSGGYHLEYRFPPPILQQLNTARGRLRLLLHQEIWKPARKLLSFPCSCSETKLASGARPPHTCDPEALAPCPCRLSTVGGYVRALEQTAAWPLDDTWTKETANTILARLDDFGFGRKVTGCSDCNQDFQGGVRSAVKVVRRYFDGLCLDCMRENEMIDKMKTRNKIRINVWDALEKSYGHREALSDWTYKCRVDHNEPTWFYSNLGRKHED